MLAYLCEECLFTFPVGLMLLLPKKPLALPPLVIFLQSVVCPSRADSLLVLSAHLFELQFACFGYNLLGPASSFHCLAHQYTAILDSKQYSHTLLLVVDHKGRPDTPMPSISGTLFCSNVHATFHEQPFVGTQLSLSSP